MLGFVNDFDMVYNYSFDLLVEYLFFMDNGDFFVDGFLFDFLLIVFFVVGK